MSVNPDFRDLFRLFDEEKLANGFDREANVPFTLE